MKALRANMEERGIAMDYPVTVMSKWPHRDKPSEYFLGAILRAYDNARQQHPGKEIAPAHLWDYVVMECLRSPGGFTTMFQWSTRKNANRIGDIMDAIGAGLVPGLVLGENKRGQKIVIDG
jgi:hypothetical protein